MTPGTTVGDDGPARAAARRRTTVLLALAAALLGAVQLLLLPPWMGEDEPWQLEYASHVAAGYRPWGGEPIRPLQVIGYDQRVLMPLSQLQVRARFHAIPAERLAATQAQVLDSMARRGFYQRVDWAGVEPGRTDFDQVAPTFTAVTQPPLYYGLVGGLVAALGADSVEQQLWVGRALSWALYVLTVLVALAIGRCAFDDERLALCVAAFVAFLPMSARQAAVVNNDVLAKLLAGLVLWLSARWAVGRARRWEAGLAVALCGLGLLAKPTVAAAVVVFGVALLMRSRRVASRGRTIGIVATLVAVVGAIVVIWMTQSSTVLPRSLLGLRTRLQVGFSLESLAKLARTLAGSFGWESRFLPDALVAGLVLVLAAAVLATAVALARGWRAGSRPVLVLCLLAVVVQLAIILLRGAGRGRYFMPAVPALGVLVVGGLVSGWPAATRQRAATALLLALVGFEAVFLWGGLMLHGYLRWSA